MIRRTCHLQEERLFDSYLTERGGEPLDPPVAEHLADCAACGSRYAELAAFMDTLRRDATRKPMPSSRRSACGSNSSRFCGGWRWSGGPPAS